MKTSPMKIKGVARKPTLVKSEEEWRQQLSPEQFEVTQKGGTERAFSGRFWNSGGQRDFVCVCCGTRLFRANTKFVSHCGWPAFDAGLDENLSHLADFSHGMVRVEVRCGTCDAHLGHVFEDGPTSTGVRYCINSLAIDEAT